MIYINLFIKQLHAIALNVCRITNNTLSRSWFGIPKPWAHIGRPQMRNHDVMLINRISCDEAYLKEHYAFIPEEDWY